MLQVFIVVRGDQDDGFDRPEPRGYLSYPDAVKAAASITADLEGAPVEVFSIMVE
jgi:hypothetical protein